MPISTVLSATAERRLVLTHYAPGEACQAHRHGEAQRSLLLAGGYIETSEEGRREVEGRTLSLKPPRFEHEDTFGVAGALILSMRGTGGAILADRYRLSRRVSPGSVQMRVGDTVLGDDATAGVTCAGPDANGEGPVPLWLLEARRRLTEQPGTPITTLAKSMGRHPVHLARQFRAVFGRPPSQVRQDERMARAIDRIVRSSLSLADVAFAEGFSDQAHMTRAVHRVSGWTPGGLRRVLAR